MGDVVFVGTGKGAVALRRNGAGAWHHDGLDLQGWLVTAATQGPDGRFYIGVTSDVYGCTLVVTEDFKTYTPLENGPRYEAGERGNDMHNRLMGAMDPMGEKSASQRYVDQIWKLHCDGERLYAGVSEAGLFVSDDLGASWQPVKGLNDHPSREGWNAGFGGLCCHSILTDSQNPKRRWVGISAAGVFRTDDGGESWISANDGVSSDEGYCVHGLAHDPDNADVIYRQDHRGFYRSDSGGDYWVLIEDGLPSDFYTSILRGAMAIDQGADFGVYFGTSAGQVFASPDGGDHWQLAADGLPKVLCVESFH